MHPGLLVTWVVSPALLSPSGRPWAPARARRASPGAAVGGAGSQGQPHLPGGPPLLQERSGLPSLLVHSACGAQPPPNSPAPWSGRSVLGVLCPQVFGGPASPGPSLSASWARHPENASLERRGCCCVPRPRVGEGFRLCRPRPTATGSVFRTVSLESRGPGAWLAGPGTRHAAAPRCVYSERRPVVGSLNSHGGSGRVGEAGRVTCNL